VGKIKFLNLRSLLDKSTIGTWKKSFRRPCTQGQVVALTTVTDVMKVLFGS